MKIRTGDKVQVIAGKDKGKQGTVMKVFTKTGRIVVEGVNIVKRHVKPGVVSKEGGIITVERPIDVSNVMYFDEKAKKPSRIGFKISDGKKVRISKASGEEIK